MKYKDKVINLLDTMQNRIDNLYKMLEKNAPLTKEQIMHELKTTSQTLEYLSETVNLEDNDFAALEGRMR